MSNTLAQPHLAEDQIKVAVNDFAGLWLILKLGRRVYRDLSVGVSLLLLAAVSVLVSARVLGELIEQLAGVEGAASGPAEPYSVEALATIFLSLEAANIALFYFGRLCLARATVQIALSMRRELFQKLTVLPVRYFDYQPLGRTITRFTSDVAGVESFFGNSFARILSSSLQILMVLSAMLLTDFEFGALVALMCLPGPVFTLLLRRPVRYWLRAYQRRQAQVNADLAEFLNGMPVIKSFGLEAWSLKLFKQGVDSHWTAALHLMNWNSFIRPMTVVLSSAPIVFVLWLGGERVLNGTLALGVLVAFVRYAERFVGPVRNLSMEIQHIQQALVSSERVRQMLSEEEETDTLGADGTLTPQIRGHIVFDRVSMGYQPGQTVLSEVTMEIQPGQTVAFVGATGSGKTSTANLIPHLYPIQAGSIQIDGYDLGTLERRSLRQQIGYVTQDVVVFSGTVRDNLLAGLAVGEIKSDRELLIAAEETGLGAVLGRLPAGLDHQLVEAGGNLSMGERQLLALTRMLLRNPAILILDEATANIDEACELLIQQAISRVMKNRTSVVIAHRLSTIVECDQVFVFDQGRVVERGSYQQLVANNGPFAKLARAQLATVSGQQV